MEQITDLLPQTPTFDPEDFCAAALPSDNRVANCVPSQSRPVSLAAVRNVQVFHWLFHLCLLTAAHGNEHHNYVSLKLQSKEPHTHNS